MNDKDFNDDYFINMLTDISKDNPQAVCGDCRDITYTDASSDKAESGDEAAFVSAQPRRPVPVPPRTVRPIPSPPRPPVRPVPPPIPPRPPVRPVPPRPPIPRPPRPIIPIIPIPIPIRPGRPADERIVLLAEEIYKQIKSLEETYMTLMRLAGRNQAEIIERMANELAVLAQSALNIYRSLSGSTSDPFRGNIYDPLPRNYCLALRVTLGRVSNLYDDVLALQRLVNIADIDRQLILMASVLQRQLTTFNTLLIDCIL